MPANKIDVIVVGAGASGAVIASELAQAGQKVVLLDKGPKHTTEDFRLKQDEIRYYARGSLVPSMDTAPITWRETSQDGDGELAPWAAGPLGTANPLHLPPSL